jgi:hypothetical protein
MALKPASFVNEDGEDEKVYEIHGLQIDAVGRVVAVNAAGIYVLDQNLENVLWEFKDEGMGVSDVERLEGYGEDIERLRLDENGR